MYIPARLRCDWCGAETTLEDTWNKTPAQDWISWPRKNKFRPTLHFCCSTHLVEWQKEKSL